MQIAILPFLARRTLDTSKLELIRSSYRRLIGHEIILTALGGFQLAEER
jgi:hypothetical protein